MTEHPDAASPKERARVVHTSHGHHTIIRQGSPDAALPPSDAAPVPTRVAYEAAYNAWLEWTKAGRGTGFESVKIAIRAAYAIDHPEDAPESSVPPGGETRPEREIGSCDRCGGGGYLTVESPRCPDCNEGEDAPRPDKASECTTVSGGGRPEQVEDAPGGPRIVCLCGSTRFWREFQRASLRETMAGRIVLSIGAASGTDDEHFGNLDQYEYDRIKTQLDELHLRKIDLADEILVLNVGGYVGESTAREIVYAEEHGKPVRFLEPVDRLPGDET